MKLNWLFLICFLFFSSPVSAEDSSLSDTTVVPVHVTATTSDSSNPSSDDVLEDETSETKAIANPAAPDPDAEPIVLPTLSEMDVLTQEAQSGSPKAALSLAKAYVLFDKPQLAEKWFRYALYKGQGMAALGLYDLAQDGKITLENPENIKQYGLGLITDDAKKGNGGSATNLGLFYLYGRYLPKDYDQAEKWLLVAEKAGKPMASYHLGVMYMNGLHHNISARQSVRHFEKASVGGIGPATRQVAIAYHTGLGRPKDLDRAISLYEKSATQGDPLAMRDLANIYLFDRPDPIQHRAWLERAANAGDADAHYALGMLLKNSNPTEATAHFKTAAEKSHFLAKVYLDPHH